MRRRRQYAIEANQRFGDVRRAREDLGRKPNDVLDSIRWGIAGTAMHDDVLKTLEDYGANTEATRFFTAGDSAELLPYATLLTRDPADAVRSALLGVYLWRDEPLAFLARGDVLAQDPARLTRVRRALALRGDAPYLAVIRAGGLTLYHLGLKGTPDETKVPISWAPQETFAILGNRRPDLPKERRSIVDVVLKLLGQAIDTLMNAYGVPEGEAISLVGRALFTRFLADRKLLPEKIAAATAFDTADLTIATSQWLDDIFNGDLLPFDRDRVAALPPDAFQALGNILCGAAGGQLELPWDEDWARLDFAYIPVGVLSQAYEAHLRTHHATRQEKEGVYYTPVAIADLMVRGALHPLPAETRAAARVLDPAAGAGVFLLIAFRHLVAEHWRAGTRPDAKVLRDILYGQLTGFDINESALRFAALGLYLMAIELDPDPKPVEKLRFEKDLRGTVLYRPGDKDDKLGSLGDGVGPEHDGRYDVVVGNPPWPTGTGLDGFETVRERVAAIATRRMGVPTAPPLPKEGLDLPFLWRAMDWVRPGGRIVLALHGRLLFQQSERMPEARQAIFAALDVTGIINGTELRETDVWPNVRAPFCLVFARNQRPGPADGFRFITPRTEPDLNKAGGWRIDPDNADIVSSREAAEQPSLFKILTRGTALDRDLLQRMSRRDLQPFGVYWSSLGLISGNGYKKLCSSSKIGPYGLSGMSAEHLKGLPDLTIAATGDLVIRTAGLDLFNDERADRARPPSLFEAPLLIIRESPPAEHGRVRTSVALVDTAFNKSFHGYSAQRHPQGVALVKYLALVIASKPALWCVLMTSGRFGVEREVVEKRIFDATPVVPFEQLDTAQRQKAVALFDDLAAEETEAKWWAVDDWVGGLFGLRRSDLQVIRDTLDYGLPFSRNRKAAEAPLQSAADMAPFCEELQAALAFWGARTSRLFRVVADYRPGPFSWQTVCIVVGDAPPPVAATDAQPIRDLANRLGMSELIEHDPTGDTLWLARLNQRRYWSRSQARLVARRLLWEHADFIKGAATP